MQKLYSEGGWKISQGDYISTGADYTKHFEKISKAEARSTKFLYAGFGVLAVFLILKVLQYVSGVTL